MMTRKVFHSYLSIGDPSGIGPEIALKACQGRADHVTMVGSAALLSETAQDLGFNLDDYAIHDVPIDTSTIIPGEISAAAGRACLAFAETAITLARADKGSIVVACPHNETAVAQAGIPFRGYPGFLAAQCELSDEDVFLMLVSEKLKIVHVTLHAGLRSSLNGLTPEKVARAIRAADQGLRQIGIANPQIAVCGIDPHAGEDGLFGTDDQEITKPAVLSLQQQGLNVAGPFGADILFQEQAFDGYIAMYHDQGHIPIKQLGRGQSFGLSIGAPLLFATVAHGSAHDIAGKNQADATPLRQIIDHIQQGFWRHDD